MATDRLAGSGRRLAAIMFTDMVGYTALAQSDEDQALRVLERHNQLLRPFFRKYKGTEVKTIGDAFLVEFESALDAVNCAVEIQKFLHDYNYSSEDRGWRINLRIGIHLGDVVHKENDVLGDAVNIASRIEPLARPEGICVTEQVYDQIHNKVRYPLRRLEGAQLKNVKFRTNVYTISLPWEEVQHNGRFPRKKPAAELDRMRVAVLPLLNLSPSAEDEYFADGMTEELIDKLSQVRGLEVIARTSAMSYKKKEMKVSDIARELRVGSIIEGSVRKAGNRIRTAVRLVDANTDGRVWSSTYDRDLGDIFVIQSDIASNVTAAIPTTLGLKAAPKSQEKETEDVAAYTYFLQAKSLLNDMSESPLRRALFLLEKAIERDPRFARAYVGRALCYRFLGTHSYIPFETAIREAKFSLRQALAISEDLAEAHAALSFVYAMNDELQAAEKEALRAIEINPNQADALASLGSIKTIQGNLEQSIQLRERAYRLDPLEPWNATALGDEYFWAGMDPKAMEIWAATVSFAPYMTYDSMMDYYVAKGDYQKARETIQIMRELDPDNPENTFWAGCLAAVTRDLDKALESIGALEKSAEQGTTAISGICLIYGALGDLDRFLEYLRRAIESHTIAFLFMKFSPLLAKVRADKRVQELLKAYEQNILGSGQHGRTESPTVEEKV